MPRSYEYPLPRKVRLGALRAALAAKLADGALLVVDTLSGGSDGAAKTKDTVAMFKTLGVTGKTLVIDVTHDDGFALTARNIAGVRLVPSSRVTARDVMDTDHVLQRREALEKLRRASDSCPTVASSQSSVSTERTGAANWQLATGAGTDMKQTDVIRRPLITEKTTLLREGGRTLVFEVAPHATKVDVKRAVEKLFGAKVEAVRTAIAHGKMKRQGRFVGQRSDWKKAYVEAPRRRKGPRVPGRGISIMPIRKYKPTSPGRRFQTVQTFDDITSTEPHRPLVEPLTSSGGRNNHGELTSWWRGGGHKRNYRVIDFKRDKRGIPATVSTIGPTRTARRASRS